MTSEKSAIKKDKLSRKRKAFLEMEEMRKNNPFPKDFDYEKGEDEVRAWIEQMCNCIDVISVGNKQIIDAIRNVDFKDFEDCLQDECAVAVGADYIVTCNIKDYEHSKVKAVTPDEMIRIIEEKGNEV